MQLFMAFSRLNNLKAIFILEEIAGIIFLRSQGWIDDMWNEVKLATLCLNAAKQAELKLKTIDMLTHTFSRFKRWLEHSFLCSLERSPSLLSDAERVRIQVALGLLGK